MKLTRLSTRVFTRKLPVCRNSLCAKTITLHNRRTFITTRPILNNNENKTNEQEQTEDTEEYEQPPADPRDVRVQELERKISELDKMIDELRAGWKSAIAEQDNIGKRAKKEIEKAKEFGVEKLCKYLFNVVDTINIIIQNKPDFEAPQNKDNVHARSAFEGIEQVKAQFLNALSDAYEIEEVCPALGDTFDPLQHNALFEVDCPPGKNIEPGKIGLVVKNAWKRKGTLLRAANVGVVKAPPSNTKKGREEKQEE